MSGAGRLYSSEVGEGRRRRTRGILRTATGSRLAEQVGDLRDTLYETNRTMSANEHMLSEFQDLTWSQSRELDSLRDELECSREMLRRGSDRNHRLAPMVRFEDQKRRMENDLERERRARERTELSQSHMPGLLDTSLRGNSSHHEQQELQDQIRAVRQQLSETQDGFSRQEEVAASVERRLREIETQAQLSHPGPHQSRQDAVVQLAQEVKQLKVLSQLQSATRRLDESVEGREELLRQVEDLCSHLAQSEERRGVLEAECGSLRGQWRQQEALQEGLRGQITDIETRLNQLLRERGVLEGHCGELRERLSEKTAVEQRLKEQCQRLEGRLAQREGEGERVRELQRKVSSMERECGENKVEMSQLRAELRSVAAEKTSLQEKVCVLEEDLVRGEGVQQRLGEEVRGLSSQLSSSEEKCSNLIGQLKATLRKLALCEEQKQALQSQVLDLESKLRMAERRNENTHSQALQALRRYRLQCRKLEQEKAQLTREKQEAMEQCEDVQRQLHCQTERGGVVIRRENLDLKARISALETQIGLQKEECQAQVLELQTENESLASERHSLEQDLSRAVEQQRVAEDRLHSHLQSREASSAENSRLQCELQTLKTENMKLLAKLGKISKAYKGSKASLAVLQSHSEEDNSRLARDLQQTQHVLSQKEQEMSEQLETLRLSHSQELDLLCQNHRTAVSKLEQRIAQLELQLADEQSMVQAVRRQQVRVLDNQHRMGDDFSRSLEDTEKLRRKYLRAKTFYEQKASSLDNKLTDVQSEENESLRHQLAESQSSLVQQAEDHEVILRATAGEVDALVQKMGNRAHIPAFPSMMGQETDTRKWIADMLVKLQWLQKEIDDVIEQEERLRRKLQLQSEKMQALRNSKHVYSQAYSLHEYAF